MRISIDIDDLTCVRYFLCVPNFSRTKGLAGLFSEFTVDKFRPSIINTSIVRRAKIMEFVPPERLVIDDLVLNCFAIDRSIFDEQKRTKLDQYA
jgi:hypothetical protein